MANEPVLTGALNIRVPITLIRRIEAFCAAQKFPPSKTDVVLKAVDEFLEREEAEARAHKPAKGGK